MAPARQVGFILHILVSTCSSRGTIVGYMEIDYHKFFLVSRGGVESRNQLNIII